MAPDGNTKRAPSERDLLATTRQRAVLDSAEQLTGIGTWEWDPLTRQLAWSDNLYRLLGFAPSEFTPTPQRLLERMDPAEAHRVQHELDAVDHGGSLPRLRCRIVRMDGAVRHLQATPVLEESGHDGGGRMVSFLQDVTEQLDVERTLAVHRAVAGALSLWGPFKPGAKRLLRDLAEALELPAAALWLPHGDTLVTRVLWSAPTVDLRMLERVLGELHMPRGMGLAGQAWARREPVTPARSGSDDGFLARMTIALEGISPAVAVPLTLEDDVCAVIVLYSGAPLEAGERLMGAFAEVGRQLGKFLSRRSGMLASPLTARELEVLTLAARGSSGPEIARSLSLSTATVKTHLANVYAKIGVPNRVGAVAYALREGLIE
jgi:DNA-binding CsgD family transcriptional regulator